MFEEFNNPETINIVKKVKELDQHLSNIEKANANKIEVIKIDINYWKTKHEDLKRNYEKQKTSLIGARVLSIIGWTILLFYTIYTWN